jgi:hypothetical protein
MKRTTTMKFLTGAAVVLLLLISVNAHAQDYVLKAGDRMSGWLEINSENNIGIRLGQIGLVKGRFKSTGEYGELYWNPKISSQTSGFLHLKSKGALILSAEGTDTSISIAPNGTGTVNVNSKRITNVATPSDSTDVATKGYVDSSSGGGIPAGYSLLGTSSTPPVGYTLTDIISSGEGWVKKTGMPQDIGIAGVVTVNKLIYVIGSNGENLVYDPSTNIWTTKTPMPNPNGTLDFAVAALNDKIYVLGGSSNDPDWPSTVGTNKVYDTVTNTWTEEKAMPTPRAGIRAVSANGKLYAIGGITYTYTQYQTDSVYMKTNEMYDPLQKTWTAMKPMLTNNVNNDPAVAENGFIYIVRGGPQRYDLAQNIWVNVSFKPTKLTSYGVAVLNNNIYVMGGYTGDSYSKNNLAEIEAYDTETGSWLKKASMPFSGSVGGASVVNGQIYIVNGSATWAYIPNKFYYVFTKK